MADPDTYQQPAATQPAAQQPQAPGGDTYATSERTPAERAEYWAKELSESRKWMQNYHANAKKIEARYLAQAEKSDDDKLSNEYNLFWSNVQVVSAILYGRMPSVTADRTNLDPADDAARVAATMLERIFNTELKSVEQSPYFVFGDAIRDLNVVGLGVAWARYAFTMSQQQVPPFMGQDGAMLAPGYTKTIIADEFAPLDYVRWCDFLLSPARRWEEVRWVARRIPMTRDMLTKRFGQQVADTVPMGPKPSRFYGNDDPLKYLADTMAWVWEIWHEETREVCWYVEGMDVPLDFMPDPLRLESFYPVKCPLRSTTSTHSFIPRPDYAFLRDQYVELDMLGARLQLLSEAVRVTGVYDKTNPTIERMLTQTTMNQLVPVDNWAMFAEKGGIKGSVDWFPLEMVVAAIDKLTARKQVVIQDIYEIYGISDIMRGVAKASETATGARLKSQFGTARVDVRQQQVAWWVTMNYRMRAEIICKHWQPETIIRRSGIMQTADAQLAQQAVQLLKTDVESIVTRINVSAETMATPDWQMEKQQRAEFLQAVSQFVGMTMPLVQQSPGSAVFLIQMLQWAAAGFKGSKQIESVLDQALQALQKDLSTPKPPKPPTAEDRKQIATAEESHADAVAKYVESMEKLMMLGIDPRMIGQIPTPGPVMPPPPGQPPQGRPPGQPGMGMPQGAMPMQGQPPMPAVPGPRNIPGPGGPPGMPVNPMGGQIP